MGFNYATAARPGRALDSSDRLAFKNIVMATDLSSAAEKGLRYAMEITKRYGARLYAIHVVAPPVYPYAPAASWPKLAEEEEVFRGQARAKLEEELSAVPHEIIFQQGAAVWPALRGLARTKAADLIVLGTHGRSGIEKALMGSVAEEIFREAMCPVLTVGPKVADKLRGGAALSRILYTTDFSLESLTAAPYAISLAREHRAHLILLNCFEGREDAVQPTMQELRQLVPFGAELRCEPFCIVERGAHGSKILEVALSHGADLLVLGVSGTGTEGTSGAHLRRSSLYRIVTQAACPVLTVRT